MKQKGKRKIQCYKCSGSGHYANRSPMKQKINDLEIDEELKGQLLNLINFEPKASSDYYNLEEDEVGQTLSI